VIVPLVPLDDTDYQSEQFRHKAVESRPCRGSESEAIVSVDLRAPGCRAGRKPQRFTCLASRSHIGMRPARDGALTRSRELVDLEMPLAVYAFGFWR
jgi:hypothetical protein